MTRLFLFLISLYRATLSPLLGQRCRFHPSCSEYARQAILAHGPMHGVWMAGKRLLRCQPFCEGGMDPVPEQRPGLLNFQRNTCADHHQELTDCHDHKH